MPVHTGKDKNGCYAKWGEKGKEYYYACDDKEAEGMAKNKAYKQGIAIGDFKMNIEELKQHIEYLKEKK